MPAARLAVLAKSYIGTVDYDPFTGACLVPKFGHDRRTLEKHVYYELQFLYKTKNYSYFWRSPIRFFTAAAYGKPAAEPVVVTMAWDDLNIYILMTVWLAVIGIYFIVWLKNSGQLELSVWLQQIITLWR